MVERASDRILLLHNVGIYLCCPNILVAKQFLNGPDVVLVLQKMRREAMAKGMAIAVLAHASPLHRGTHRLLDRCLGGVMPPEFAIIP